MLESEAELPMPSKALRVLSSYLVEETDLDQHLSGKQLFKMTFVELYGDPTIEDATDMEPPVITNLKADEASSLTRLNKYIELLIHTDPESLEKIREIDEILMRED